MMTGALAYHAAKVQQVELIARADMIGHVPDEAFECATASQYTDKQVARVDLRQASRRQLEPAVGCAISQRAYNHRVSGMRRAVRAHHPDSLRQVKRRRGRSDLIYLYQLNLPLRRNLQSHHNYSPCFQHCPRDVIVRCRPSADAERLA